MLLISFNQIEIRQMEIPSTRDNQLRDHIAIAIGQSDESLITSIRDKLESISSSHCICRVKESLHLANEKAYVPDKVSIGPYHHGKENLKVMENHKWKYVHALVSRKPNLESSLNDCVVALKEIEHRAKSCYECQEFDMRSNEFVQMLLIDGTFIIELFLRYSIKSLRRRNDPIFTTPGMLFELRCNLILLENQIPLFVIQRLFQVLPIPKQCTYSLAELAHRFFKNMIPGDQQLHREKFNQEGNHLLDLICHCLLPTLPRLQPKLSKPQKQLRGASELKASGIKLKRARTDNLLDIKFTNGVLEIPPVLIHQNNESLFRNLIALEHCTTDSVQHITSYVVLIKSLTSNRRDKKLLVKHNILTDYDVAEKEDEELFNDLCKEVDLKTSYYDGLCEQVNGYKARIKIRTWSKKLKRNYQKNPLLRVMFFVAILVLCLTLIGTLFSVLSFFVHRI